MRGSEETQDKSEEISGDVDVYEEVGVVIEYDGVG